MLLFGLWHAVTLPQFMENSASELEFQVLNFLISYRKCSMYSTIWQHIAHNYFSYRQTTSALGVILKPCGQFFENFDTPSPPNGQTWSFDEPPIWPHGLFSYPPFLKNKINFKKVVTKLKKIFYSFFKRLGNCRVGNLKHNFFCQKCLKKL